ncbi:hypothetical protein [Vibrio barjaei]|uniref:hypothetical protein n=1 Tax=Vibrio barjaei TaxID=1676683 RepID=UPI002285391A|nr:hypothetical protein [Vibrio barjaei]MCY9874610.1 hypothetical protein [Vibrio barjaei]
MTRTWTTIITAKHSIVLEFIDLIEGLDFRTQRMSNGNFRLEILSNKTELRTLGNKVYQMLEHVETDIVDDEVIVKEFLDFKGVPNTEIWHWIEKRFNVEVGSMTTV